jgi:hypothetical protein
MENKEIVIVPENVQRGDVICILSGTDSACALRDDRHGQWTLVSGDCYIFTESFWAPNKSEWSMYDKYIEQNQARIQQFRIR